MVERSSTSPRTSIRGKLAVLAGVPVAGALLLALFVIHDARQGAASAASLGSIEDLARLTSSIADVLHAVQDERAERAVAAARGALPRTSGAGTATPTVHDTDRAVQRLQAFLSNRDRSKLPVRLARGLVASEASLDGLSAVRTRVEHETVRLQEVLAAYGAASTALVSTAAALSELTDDGEMLRSISATVALLELEERSSVEQAIVGFVATRGDLPPGAYKALVTTTTEESIYDQAFRTSASDDVRQQFEEARGRGAAAKQMLEGLLGSTEDTVVMDIGAWTVAQGSAVHELRDVERTLLGRVETAAASKGAELRKTIRLSILVSGAVIFLSLSMAVLVGRGVQGSVAALADAAGRVRASRDFSVRAVRASDDELGMLTDTFNDMLAGIQSRDVELEQHRLHLEGLVVARTRELAARNAALRLVLDHVDQGLATIDLDGELHSERSAAFDRWFGSSRDAMPFSEAIAADEERLRLQLELGWDQVAAGLLPYEVSVEQLPKRFDRGGRHFALSVKLLSDGDALIGGLLVVSDVTAELEARKEQARQREEVQVFRRLARDRAAFAAFLEETGSLVERLRSGTQAGSARLALVHTVKGNAAQYEVASVAEAAHEIESAILDPDASAVAPWSSLFEAWDALARRVGPLVGTSDSTIELSRRELDRLIRDVAAGMPGERLAAHLRRLLDEPVATRFARLSDHAERLASRLGKPVPAFTIQTDDLRLPRRRYASFWAVLVHVVRNAVDHGIEGPIERAAAGKPARGSVAFRARLEDEAVVIEVADDGAGIDWERLAAKARAAGLPAARRIDVERAMFASGISSADQVTDLSGRGVGLAAVWGTTVGLGGTVRVDSVRGRETRFEFRLPIAGESGGAS